MWAGVYNTDDLIVSFDGIPPQSLEAAHELLSQLNRSEITLSIDRVASKVSDSPPLSVWRYVLLD